MWIIPHVIPNSRIVSRPQQDAGGPNLYGVSDQPKSTSPEKSMSRTELNEAQASRALELSRRIEAAGIGNAVRIQQAVASGGPIVGQVLGFTVPMRAVVAPDYPSPLPQRVQALMRDLQPGPAPEQVRVHEAKPTSKDYSPSGHLLNRFKAIQRCFVEHASRCNVILSQDAQQAIFMRRTLDLIPQMQVEVGHMKLCVTGNGHWNQDGAGGAEARLARLTTLNATLGAAVRARAELFAYPPTLSRLRESPGDDRPQWRRFVEQYERDINRYMDWASRVSADLEAFAAPVVAKDREVQIDSQLALMAAGSFRPHVGVAHLLNLTQGSALDLDAQPFDISTPLDREWIAIETTTNDQAAGLQVAHQVVDEEQDNFAL